VLDLADTLSGHPEDVTYLFERQTPKGGNVEHARCLLADEVVRAP
jgi:hypothetical protein